MEKLEWKAVLYNGLETNIEVTKCGKVRKVKVDWYGNGKGSSKVKYGEVDFDNLKLGLYKELGIQIKGLKRRTKTVHQLVAAAFLDYKFNGYENVVDHIDSNHLNNNLENLRVISHRENMSKERTKKSGLPVGVCYRKDLKKYQSKITINKKIIALGTFKTIEEASNAYKLKLKENYEK